VDDELAAGVAMGLGIPVPAAQPVVSTLPMVEYEPSPALSLMARPGDGTIRSRRVAVFVADGVDGASARSIYESLLADGAVPRFVGAKLGQVTPLQGAPLNVEISIESGPSVLYDAVVIPDGEDAVAYWKMDANAVDFIKEQFRHCKPLMVIGAAAGLLAKAGIPEVLPAGGADPGLVNTDAAGMEQAIAAFKLALAGHRNFARETDPPLV
jgi:catalase